MPIDPVLTPTILFLPVTLQSPAQTGTPQECSLIELRRLRRPFSPPSTLLRRDILVPHPPLPQPLSLIKLLRHPGIPPPCLLLSSNPPFLLQLVREIILVELLPQACLPSPLPLRLNMPRSLLSLLPQMPLLLQDRRFFNLCLLFYINIPSFLLLTCFSFLSCEPFSL